MLSTAASLLLTHQQSPTCFALRTISSRAWTTTTIKPTTFGRNRFNGSHCSYATDWRLLLVPVFASSCYSALRGPLTTEDEYSGNSAKDFCSCEFLRRHSIGKQNDDLLEHERSVINTFKRVSGSTAYIHTTAVIDQHHSGVRFHATEVPAGTGSGFLWDSHGHVVTNFHVVAGGGYGGVPGSVKVKLSGLAEAREAEVVGVEPENDLAVLKLKDTRNLPPPIEVGTSSDLQVGQSVLAIGNPFGLDDTLTMGIVSALGRDVYGVGGRQIRGCVQTDAAINPGNSGGPLLDSRGRLIGVSMAIVSPTAMGGNIGIGFAIPVDTVRRTVNQIIKYGRVIRPSLGISIVDDRLVQVMASQLGRPLDGVLVADVAPSGPAAYAGLVPCRMGRFGSIELGDLITHIDEKPVATAEDLFSAIEERKVGEVVRAKVLRHADPRHEETLTIKLAPRENVPYLVGGGMGSHSKRGSW